MSARRGSKNLSEDQIDQIVVEKSNGDSPWDEPVHVERTEPASLFIPPNLPTRTAFLARLHRTETVDEWLTHVIRERVDLEEAAYIGAKQELAQAQN